MMPWWAGNQTAMFLFVVACVPIAFLVLRPLKDKPHQVWKKIDIVVVVVGGFGLLSLVFQAQSMAAHVMKPWFEREVQADRRMMVITLSTAQLVCVPRPRIDGSPLNNEEIERERAAICAWITTQFQPEAERIIKGDDTMFSLGKWGQFPTVSDKTANVLPIFQNGEGIKETARNWNEALARLQDSKQELFDNWVYLLLVLISPYALSIAFSLQLVKVCYEARR